MSTECRGLRTELRPLSHSVLSPRHSVLRLMGKRIVIPRELLLVEVERWCDDHACNARTRLSLTKAEARAYTGFECSRCERWNEDALKERDIPEWWEELKEEGEGGDSF